MNGGVANKNIRFTFQLANQQSTNYSSSRLHEELSGEGFESDVFDSLLGKDCLAPGEGNAQELFRIRFLISNSVSACIASTLSIAKLGLRLLTRNSAIELEKLTLANGPRSLMLARS